jgi:undecaprenyl pyrophosphate phosphatase UppP
MPVAAFISAWLAIKLFMNIIQNVSLRGFAYYCLAAGILVMLFL